MPKYRNNRLFKAWASMPSQSAITSSWNARQIAAANSRRIAKLSKQVYRNMGEMKVKHVSLISSTMPNASTVVQELTLIAQGDDCFDREANHVFVKGLKIRGITSNPNLDVYVVLSKNGTAPSYGDYQNRVGGFLYAPRRNEFTVLATIRPNNSTLAYPAGAFYNCNVNFNMKFNTSTYYNGSASGNGVRNKIYLVIKNDTGSVQGYELCSELYFRDN